MNKLNGFNNGRDTSDGVGGRPGPFQEQEFVIDDLKLLETPDNREKLLELELFFINKSDMTKQNRTELIKIIKDLIK